MNIGTWYESGYLGQPRTPQDMYFLPLAQLKHGGWSGILVESDPSRPRAKPRAKKSSVHTGPRGSAGHWEVLWNKAREVPARVIDAAATRGGTSRDRARASSRRDPFTAGTTNGNPRNLQPGDLVYDRYDPNVFGRVVRLEYDPRWGLQGSALVQLRQSHRSANVFDERGHVASEFRAKGSSLYLPTSTLVLQEPKQVRGVRRAKLFHEPHRDPAPRGTSPARVRAADARVFERTKSFAHFEVGGKEYYAFHDGSVMQVKPYVHSDREAKAPPPIARFGRSLIDYSPKRRARRDPGGASHPSPGNPRGLDVGDAVQLRHEPGTFGTIARFERNAYGEPRGYAWIDVPGAEPRRVETHALRARGRANAARDRSSEGAYEVEGKKFASYGDAQRHAQDLLRRGTATRAVIRVQGLGPRAPWFDREAWTIGRTGKFKHDYVDDSRASRPGRDADGKRRVRVERGAANQVAWHGKSPNGTPVTLVWNGPGSRLFMLWHEQMIPIDHFTADGNYRSFEDADRAARDFLTWRER